MAVNSSLKSKAAKGMAWSAFGTFSSQGISFVIGIILARILMPADYGLIGMLAIFFAVSQIFVESGFSNALIQKIDRTETDYSTIFYFNLLVGLLLYLILFISAPYIADFYRVPDLTLLTRVLSLNILIGAFAIVQQARLKILMDFKTPSLIMVVSVVISGALGIFLAYNGYGVWALVVQSLTGTTLRTILYFVYNKWLPKLIFSRQSLNQLFGFSSKLLAAGLIATVVNNLYSILIGKLFNSTDLGYYTRAKQFPELLANTLTNVLQGVTYPILTSLQNERERMVQVYSRLMRITVFFVMPALTMFALLAEPFIRLFLTEKWMPVVPLIQWLCFARMITPISALNMNILNAIGRSDLFFKVDTSKVPLTLTILILTVPFGLKVVVIGHFVTSAICFFINAYYPGKMFAFGAKRQLIEMKTVIFATLIMSACVSISNQVISNDMMQLISGLLVGPIVYLIAAHLLKIEELNELKEMAQQLAQKLRP